MTHDCRVAPFELLIQLEEPYDGAFSDAAIMLRGKGNIIGQQFG
jgi:hypothetical protein